jgi:hypothetical protein
MTGAQVVILLVALISAGSSIVVAILNVHQNRRIETIHVLVNDRLDRALKEIEQLKKNS